MKVVVCENGHHYDADRYDTCPHCGSPEALDNKKEQSYVQTPVKKTEEKKEYNSKETHTAKGFHNIIGGLGKKRKTHEKVTEEKHMGMMECPHCHAKIEANLNFCTNCGKKIVKVSEKRQSENKDKKCPKCGTPYMEGDLFCENCGNSLKEVAARCVKCGHPLKPGASFCTECGYHMDEEPIGNITPQIKSTDEKDSVTRSAEHQKAEFIPEQIQKPVTEESSITVDYEEEPLQEGLKDILDSAIADTPEDTDHTIGFFDIGETKTVVGWIVCVKGINRGESFNITSGKNTLGRSLTNHITIAKEQSISREKHAVIIFEPNEKKFFIQAGEGSGLTYVNGKLVLTFEELKIYDKITLGKADFLFIPLVNDEFTWEDYADGEVD